MKTLVRTCVAGLIAIPAICFAQAGGCDAKRHAVEQEIDYAQAHGNARRAAGLETALAQLNANCTDATLRSVAQRKVDQAQHKLAERQRDLQKAKAEGKGTKKIADRQRKVDEAHAELERVQAEAAQ